jgi:hypothetical protein
MVKLAYPKLWVAINAANTFLLDPNYTLGKKFTVKFVVKDNKLDVYYNGSANPVYSTTIATTENYFKAGGYTQSNCTFETDCSSNNYGEAKIYSLSVTHE